MTFRILAAWEPCAMENQNITSVAIVGGGVAAWMSAAFIAHMLGKNVSVTVVEIPEGDDACLRGSTLPPIKAFLGTLGMTEAQVISKAQGSMKLGTQFVNWGQLGNRYFHPHGNYGAEFDAVPLHQWWLKQCADDGGTIGLDQLSLASALAGLGRFTHPVPDRRMIQSTHDYAYHLENTFLADVFKARAVEGGVALVSATDIHVRLEGENEYVVGVSTAEGIDVDADFFLDCTGPKSLLIGAGLNTPFENWSAYLPCDKVLTVSSERASDLLPFSTNIARDAGWQWRAPLQHETQNGYVYASKHCSDDDALAVLMENLDGRALSQPKTHGFINGRRAQSFVKNVVAIGDAAGFLEPLESTSLQLIQSALTRLLALWPTKAFHPIVAQEYNELTATEWDLARDFLVLHYHLNTRSDSTFWRACQDISVPDSLKHRLQHWDAGARLVSPRSEVFQSASWLSVLVGQGALPKGRDPLVEARVDLVDYNARLAGIVSIIVQTAATMPSHREWIDKNARGPRL
jgi:tryptophan 7-halogenase